MSSPSEEKDVRELVAKYATTDGDMLRWNRWSTVDLDTALHAVPGLLTALQSAEQRATRLAGENSALERARAVGMERICDLEADRDKLAGEVERLRMAIMGGEDAPGYAMSLTLDTVLKVAAENNRLWMAASDRATAAEAQLAGVVEALEPFAEAARHLHPSQPNDGLTLDGIEVRRWRRAAEALAALSIKPQERS